MSVTGQKPFHLHSDANSFIHKLLFHLAQRCSNEVFWIRSPNYQEQIYVSPSYHKVWGRNITDLIADPKGWINTIHPKDQSHMSKSIERRNANISRDAQLIENYRIVCPDGKIKWIKDTSYPIYNQDNQDIKLLGFAGIAQDITADKLKEEKRQIEEKNNIAKQMTQKLKVTSVGLSYGIRNPMAGIRLGLDRIRQLFTKLTRLAKQAQACPNCQSHSEVTLEELIEHQQLVTKMMQRIDTGIALMDMQLKNMVTDQIEKRFFQHHEIKDSIEQAVKTFPLEDQSSLNQIHMDIKHPFTILGDRMLTRHMLWNLLNNALSVMKVQACGEIFITTEALIDYNVLHFKDTAKGISKEEATQVFEPFHPNHEKSGGLGLHFCQLVMKAYDGRIECRAKEGEYTEFLLFFPKNLDDEL